MVSRGSRAAGHTPEAEPRPAPSPPKAAVPPRTAPSRSPRTKGPPGAPQGFHAATEKKQAVIKPSANYSPEEKGRPARSPVGVTRSVRAGAGGARRRRSGARGEGSAQRLPPAARFAFYRAAAAAASP